MTLIKATQQVEQSGTWYGEIVEYIKKALYSLRPVAQMVYPCTLYNRSTWTISFIHREGNGVAYALAKLGFTFAS